jgi:hypothetical protein
MSETIVFISLLSTILALGAVCFSEVVRLRGAQERYQQRLDRADFILRRVAKDVRAARAFLDSAAEFRSDRNTLILDSGPMAVVYHVSRKGLERIELASPARRTSVMAETGRLAVSFDVEPRQTGEARCAVTTITWDEPPAIGISHPALSLRTAIRNAP